MRGCLKNFLAGVGCLTVLALVALAAWHFRGDLSEAYRSLVGDSRADQTGPTFTVGRPSSRSLRSAEAKEQAMAQPSGPDQIVLTADEMASIIWDRFTTQARRALDSMVVILERDRFALQADLVTEVFGGDLLAPLRGMIDPREAVRVSGPATIRAPGVVAWEIDEFVVASFPFPRPTVPLLVDRLTGGTDGVILLSVPASVRGLRVTADGVTFFRRAE